MSHNPQVQAYCSLFPQARVTHMDFSTLEDRTVATLLHSQGKSITVAAIQQFKNAVRTGRAYSCFDPYLLKGIQKMPRHLFSFHPARNNQIVHSTIQTNTELQEALDDNPDFVHISCDPGGQYWLIHKGPINARSATAHARWKDLSTKRVPKPVRAFKLLLG